MDEGTVGTYLGTEGDYSWLLDFVSGVFLRIDVLMTLTELQLHSMDKLAIALKCAFLTTYLSCIGVRTCRFRHEFVTCNL